MEERMIFESKPVRDTTVLCEVVACAFNDSGMCEADSIAIIDGKCGLNTTRPDAYHESEDDININVSMSSKQPEPSQEKEKPRKRRVRVFAGTDWS